jgi:hypothetical protein
MCGEHIADSLFVDFVVMCIVCVIHRLFLDDLPINDDVISLEVVGLKILGENKLSQQGLSFTVATFITPKTVHFASVDVDATAIDITRGNDDDIDHEADDSGNHCACPFHLSSVFNWLKCTSSMVFYSDILAVFLLWFEMLKYCQVFFTKNKKNSRYEPADDEGHEDFQTETKENDTSVASSHTSRNVVDEAKNREFGIDSISHKKRDIEESDYERMRNNSSYAIHDNHMYTFFDNNDGGCFNTVVDDENGAFNNDGRLIKHSSSDDLDNDWEMVYK